MQSIRNMQNELCSFGTMRALVRQIGLTTSPEVLHEAVLTTVALLYGGNQTVGVVDVRAKSARLAAPSLPCHELPLACVVQTQEAFFAEAKRLREGNVYLVLFTRLSTSLITRAETSKEVLWQAVRVCGWFLSTALDVTCVTAAVTTEAARAKARCGDL